MFAALAPALFAGALYYGSQVLRNPGRKPPRKMAHLQGQFQPEVADVLVVKAMMSKGIRPGHRQEGIPLEIVDMIIDHAEYWPHTETTRNFGNGQRGNRGLTVLGGRPGMENKFLARTPPLGFTKTPVVNGSEDSWTILPCTQTRQPEDDTLSTETCHKLLNNDTILERPARKVVFNIRSSDQGWGGEREHRGTYRSSWTWFEAGLEELVGISTSEVSASEDDDKGEVPQFSRSSQSPPPAASPFRQSNLRCIKPDNPENHQLAADPQLEIQRNKLATKDPTDHEIVWSWTDNINPNSARADELHENGRGKASGSGEFVRNLKLGDVITVWGKARFPGWANRIEKLSIEVYWAV